MSQPAANQAAPPSAAVLELPHAKQPLAGVTTGGKPSDAQLLQAKQLGYHSVISLLPESEMAGEAERVRELGMRFVSIPVPDASGLTEANARRLAEAMDAPDAKPLVLHCGTGNRAGALLALRAFYVDGAKASEALELGERAGLTSLRPQVEAQLQAAAAR
ncbi:MAG TPA: sulfur transferase domain-containing protein [Polyangiales bacterium]|nr:sulfur transferase domain-containing protein [Polyangiales bacterium]